MSKTLRTKNMVLIRQIELPEDGGTVTLYENPKADTYVGVGTSELIVHRYAARGKIENWVANYELIDEENESSLHPINLEYGNKILDRIEEGDNYSNVFIFYTDEAIESVLPTEKSIEEHTYTSTGIKFWRHQEAMFNYKNGDPNTVISTHISPEGSCNLKCPFCFQTDKSFTRKPYMGVINLEFFKNIIDQADDLGVGAITLGSRGEPTMHKKFTDILNFISTKKNIMEVKLNTNGSYLTEDMCHSILKNNLTQIVISSDHYIKKDYERLRLGSNFEKVVANVDMLFNIRAKNYPNSITEIRVSGVDNDKNLDREKFKNFWIKRCDHVSASFPLERWDTYNNKPHPEINDPCENLWDRMYIWFDGKVNPCDADYKSLLSYGNAKDKTIQEHKRAANSRK